MRIALVAPLAEAVPPKLYGGTERVVSWLAEELVRQGHKVTLFASGGSQTEADLVVRTASLRMCARSILKAEIIWRSSAVSRLRSARIEP